MPFSVGHTPWNKGKSGVQSAWNKGLKGLQPWQNISGLQKGHKKGEYKPTPETIEKNRVGHLGQPAWNKGKKVPQYAGENHWNWQGGKTAERARARKSIEYKAWRADVFKRDQYTCIWCGYKGKELNADHIKPWALYPELRFDLDNGRTLCIGCHIQTDTYLNSFGLNQYKQVAALRAAV